jgi:hypothetical protein
MPIIQTGSVIYDLQIFVCKLRISGRRLLFIYLSGSSYSSSVAKFVLLMANGWTVGYVVTRCYPRSLWLLFVGQECNTLVG